MSHSDEETFDNRFSTNISVYDMISPRLITNLKRTVIACMAFALAVTSWMLLTQKSQPQDRDTVTTNGGTTPGENGKLDMTEKRQMSANDHLASIPVIILNNGKELPLAITVGDRSIEIPGPSSWPGATPKGRFVAGIVDTADVLRANGFSPDDTFSLSVGGTALNASNTFRVEGNPRPDLASNRTDGYSEEYRTRPDDEGIWRSLKFKNIVLSYGQVPSLTDFLVASPADSAAQTSPITNELPALNHQLADSTDDSGNTGEDMQKYREALNNSDPAVRAKGIQDLVLFSDLASSDKSQPSVATSIEKALADKDSTVREAALHSLDLWDGDIPMETLSRVVLNDQDPKLRMHALRLLVDRFDRKSLPTLLQASRDPDTQVAQKASQLLGTLSP
jgi:hypothetical protein